MNCDAIAPWYRWLEYLTFGPALQRRRREYLGEVASAKKVLILGDGDGRFTAAFLARSEAAIVDSVDISPGMMRLAERRIRRLSGHEERVEFYVDDALTMELPGSYDLFVSHYFLDCFTTSEVEKLVSRVSGKACAGARWLISDFRIPDDGFRRVAAVVLIKALYWSFGILTGLTTKQLPDYAAALKAGGFRRVRESQGFVGLLVSELWER